ncbi:La-related protein 7 [Dioscorea alata]|uniref:La-related protein 7 n=1 Tax=Dioscorea alata TaxID=55571 RepID=A0ACB7W1C5_DIOAL|nr:La-related protein 7 [Dioscorea alata]
MEQEALDAAVEIPADPSPAPPNDPALTRSLSSSRLNARAPEFVPRSAPPMVKIHHHGPPPPPQAMIHVYHAPASSPPPFIAPVVNPGAFEYFVAGGFGGEQEVVQSAASADPDPPPSVRDGLSDEVVQKITKQVEYYFSDANLATTEHLMRFISKDPEGFVPMPVIASFKKIKALVHNNSLLADALRKSLKLVVSEDGKKVRRQQPITETDVEELQSRIVVAENLPEDHCYQSLMKIFSAVGSVKSIRTCYPQTSNGTSAPANRATKMDMLFGNRLHAFVEYETSEDAEKAVSELNDERNWRSGLRVRLLHRCMSKHGPGRGRKGGHEGDGNGEEEDVSTSNQPQEKQTDDFSLPSETTTEHGEEVNDKEDVVRRGKGRGRGGRGRGRGQYHNNHHHNNNKTGGHAIGTPPSSHPIQPEQPAIAKQPPGPRMPDGTRGFTIGRGKPIAPPTCS